MTYCGGLVDASPESTGTARLGVSLPERGKPSDALSLGIDRPASTIRVLAPMRDKPPTQQIERALARLVVMANDVKLLTRRDVV